MSANEQVSQGEEAEYEKTPSKYDRSEPPFGEAPLFKMPQVWEGELANGMKTYGIENNELPLINFTITIPGGHRTDNMEKAGVASLAADLMNEGTSLKTPAELEEAIGLLGSSLGIYSGLEETVISGNCLARNFEATMALVEEMLLQPRWDEAEYERLMQELKTGLKGREANPTAIAAINFNKLIYGPDHIYSVPTNGTLDTAQNITLEDVKQYYNQYIKPGGASFHVVGDLSQAQVENALAGLSERWTGSAEAQQDWAVNSEGEAGTLYFIDVPNSKQSVLYIGKMALAAGDVDAPKLRFANEIIGGGSSGRLFQTLRIQKGYTYGAYSRVPARADIAPYIISSSVRANATLPSLEIIQNMVREYGAGFTEADVELTKNKVVKQNTRAYESFGAKLGILQNISKYGRSKDYIDQDQKTLMNMNLDDFKGVINQYIQESEMIYIVVGDKATQNQEVEKLGLDVVELDIFGNPLNYDIAD